MPVYTYMLSAYFAGVRPNLVSLIQPWGIIVLGAIIN